MEQTSPASQLATILFSPPTSGADEPNSVPERERDAAIATVRILIVEDEVFVAMDAEAILSSAGYEVVGTAATANDAVAKAEQLAPDLILMDIRLIGPRDGIDAALEILRRFAIPVLFVTANVDPVTHARAMQAQPLEILSKPFTRDSLLDAVGRARKT